MPARKVLLATDQFYHIYNRGVVKQPIFFTKRDYDRFLLTIQYYLQKNPPTKLSRLIQLPKSERESILSRTIERKDAIVEILSYAFMPNHFHLLVRQLCDNGISVYLSKIINSYTRYINTKLKRVGHLFQGSFKAVRLASDEELLHMSRYIHLNPLVSYLVAEKDFLTYPWTSMKSYLSDISTFINRDHILGHFKGWDKYKQFVLDNAKYGKKLEEMKHLLIEKYP